MLDLKKLERKLDDFLSKEPKEELTGWLTSKRTKSNNRKNMTYNEAIEESLTREWKSVTCSQGEQCWCRAIECVPMLKYTEGEIEHPFYAIGPGEVMSEIVEHFVKLHNESLISQKDNKQ